MIGEKLIKNIMFITLSGILPAVSAAAGTADLSVAPVKRSQVEEIKGGHKEFTIQVNGLTPPVNLGYSIQGNADDVRVRVKGGLDFSSIEALVRNIVRPGMTDEEKAKALFYFAVDNFYDRGSRGCDDPLEYASLWGASWCGNFATFLTAAWEAAGLKSLYVNPTVGLPTGHGAGEVYYDNQWHMYDARLRGYYLNRDNRTIASLADLDRDDNLIRRAVDYENRLMGHWSFFLQHIMYYDTGSDWFARYEKDLEHEHSRYNLDCPVWDPRVSLRAGERLEMRWDNRGKWWNRKDFSPQWLKFHPHEGIEARTVPPIIYANGRLEFTADPSRYKREAESWSKIRAGRKPSPAFLPAATGRWCHLVYKVRAPYFIPEATISASVFRRTERDSVRVEISTDQGKTWQALWQMGETGETPLKITTDETQRVTWHSSHKYSYLVRFSMLSSGKPGNVRVGQIHLSTDLYYRPVILPELKHGENTVVYSDKSKGRHTRQVTFRWLEDTNILLSDNRPAEGDAIKVTAVVKNQGEAAARDIVVRFYNGDPEKGGEKIGEDQVIGVIEPGGTGRASVRWQASQKQIGAPQGYSLALDAPITGYTHNTLFVRVDPEGKIGESDRSNNVTSRDVIVYNKANLILYHPSFITFDRLGNDQIRITAMIRNQNIYGLLPRAREARDIVVRFYDGPPEIGSPLIGEAVIPEIQRGEFGRAKVVWDTGNLSGRHAIHVQVDPDDRIPEKWQSRPGKYMQIKKEIEL